MEKIILITGSETLLGRKLVEKNLSAGNKVIAPVLSKEENGSENQKSNLLVVPWNKSSIISTRTVIREGMRVFRKIDEAILVYSENKTNDKLADFSTSDIDESIESSIRGTVYLTKEIMKSMESQGVSLSFAVTRKNRVSPNPLEQGFKSFFKSFADSIISDEKGIYKCAFTTELTDMDSYASFIRSTLDELPEKGKGQWIDYKERKNLFSALPVVPRKPEII